jgi:lycopene beta-cyclase
MRTVGIRGAGVAGCALAQALKARFPELQITIFDRRPRLPHPPRTFCFFETGRVSASVTPAMQWRRVRVAGGDFSRVIDCSATPYTLVRGDDFFESAVHSLEELGVQFVWQAGESRLGPTAVTLGGGTYRFDLVVDAAFDPAPVVPRLWQSFAGVLVETERPSFDCGEATLMELQGSSTESPLSFMYVLPFSATTALVEHTTFSFSQLTEAEHFAFVERWLRARGIDRWRELAREHGAIPMGLDVGKAPPWPVVGTAGGGVRAGTGYGYQGIHQQVQRLADDLSRGAYSGGPWRFDPTRAILRIGDRLLLRALRRRPECGEDILGALLKTARDSDLVAFLAGEADLLQSLRVMSCVPKRQMVGALWY